MMKKIFALLLAAIMCLSFIACGNTQQTNSPIKTKDELLKEAKVVKADELLNEIGGNKAKAATYVGSIYCITGHVVEIEEDHCLLLGADTGDWNNVIHSDDWYAYAELAMFRVYLPAEELAKLNKCENVFIGREPLEKRKYFRCCDPAAAPLLPPADRTVQSRHRAYFVSFFGSGNEYHCISDPAGFQLFR
jgi:hypothetical protein